VLRQQPVWRDLDNQGIDRLRTVDSEKNQRHRGFVGPSTPLRSADPRTTARPAASTSGSHVSLLPAPPHDRDGGRNGSASAAITMSTGQTRELRPHGLGKTVGLFCEGWEIFFFPELRRTRAQGFFHCTSCPHPSRTARSPADWPVASAHCYSTLAGNSTALAVQ
jgi:hypothetical protein